MGRNPFQVVPDDELERYQAAVRTAQYRNNSNRRRDFMDNHDYLRSTIAENPEAFERSMRTLLAALA